MSLTVPPINSTAKIFMCINSEAYRRKLGAITRTGDGGSNVVDAEVGGSGGVDDDVGDVDGFAHLHANHGGSHAALVGETQHHGGHI